MASKQRRQPWTCLHPLYRPGHASLTHSPAGSDGSVSGGGSALSSPPVLQQVGWRTCISSITTGLHVVRNGCVSSKEYHACAGLCSHFFECLFLTLQAVSQLAASSGSDSANSAASAPVSPHVLGPAGLPGRQGSDDAEGQVVYELQGLPQESAAVAVGQGGADWGHGQPGAAASPGTVRRVLNDEIEASGGIRAAAAAIGATTAASANGGPGALYGCLGDALGGLGDECIVGDGDSGSAAAAPGVGEAAFHTAGLQQFAAKLRNGSGTPVVESQAALARYAGYEDSVDSRQTPMPHGLASAGSSSAGVGGLMDGSQRGAAGSTTRPRVPPLRFSRMNVAELLHGSEAEGSSQHAQQGQHRLLSMSRHEADSISRLAASMHSSGLGAVTPGDIRAALSGGRAMCSCMNSCQVSVLVCKTHSGMLGFTVRAVANALPHCRCWRRSRRRSWSRCSPRKWHS